MNGCAGGVRYSGIDDRGCPVEMTETDTHGSARTDTEPEMSDSGGTRRGHGAPCPLECNH